VIERRIREMVVVDDMQCGIHLTCLPTSCYY